MLGSSGIYSELVHLLSGTIRRGSRCSTAKGFLRPIRLRKNLHIAMQTQALRLLFDKAGPVPRAIGVEILRDGRKHIIRARKEIISSAGAINSPQLLMVSGEFKLKTGFITLIFAGKNKFCRPHLGKKLYKKNLVFQPFYVIRKIWCTFTIIIM